MKRVGLRVIECQIEPTKTPADRAASICGAGRTTVVHCSPGARTFGSGSGSGRTTIPAADTCRRTAARQTPQVIRVVLGCDRRQRRWRISGIPNPNDYMRFGRAVARRFQRQHVWVSRHREPRTRSEPFDVVKQQSQAARDRAEPGRNVGRSHETTLARTGATNAGFSPQTTPRNASVSVILAFRRG